jgi:hypothetical protein
MRIGSPFLRRRLSTSESRLQPASTFLGSSPENAKKTGVSTPGLGAGSAVSYSVGHGSPILTLMKFQPALPCQQCGARDPVTVPLNSVWFEWACPKCGNENAVLSPTGWTLGGRILEKAVFEYQDVGDYSTSVIFSATAVEAELARLFAKWRKIDTIREEGRVPSDEELGEAYRRLGFGITERIEGVGRLLDDRGIDGFARDSELAERIENDFPSLNLGSLAEDIRKAVFWPRNRILHAGFTQSQQEEAKRANNIARLTLELLKEMDASRRARTPA